MTNREDVEIEEEEDGTERAGWASTGTAVLRRGWWFGKRVAIAGAAITCAPIVIPPLVALSFLGLAFSVPSGIYLAGYACTDIIMNALLPLPTLKKDEGEETMESKDVVERGFDTVHEDEKALGKEKWEKIDTSEGGTESCRLILVPGKGETGIEILEFDKWSEGEPAVENLKTWENVGEKEEMAKGVDLKNDTAAVADESRNSDLVCSSQEEDVHDSASAASESNESPKHPYTVVVMAPKEESKRENESPDMSQEHLSIVEEREKEKSDDALEKMQPKEVMKDRKKDVGDDAKGLSISNGVSAKDEGFPEDCRSEVELPSLTSESVLSKKEDIETLVEVESMDHKSVAKPGINVVEGSAGLTGVHSDDERMHDEEQLWDQIIAMRTIVGYKIAMGGSLVEELRALCLFIGVEPPLALKDMPELMEIFKSLQLLKSVVGVE